MTINFKTPEIKELQPRLLVLGVGGAGGNAINEMIDNNLHEDCYQSSHLLHFLLHLQLLIQEVLAEALLFLVF